MTALLPFPQHLCSPSGLPGDESLFGMWVVQPRHRRAGSSAQCCGQQRGAGPGCAELAAEAALRVRGCHGNSAAEPGPKPWGQGLFSFLRASIVTLLVKSQVKSGETWSLCNLVKSQFLVVPLLESPREPSHSKWFWCFLCGWVVFFFFDRMDEAEAFYYSFP